MGIILHYMNYKLPRDPTKMAQTKIHITLQYIAGIFSYMCEQIFIQVPSCTMNEDLF